MKKCFKLLIILIALNSCTTSKQIKVDTSTNVITQSEQLELTPDFVISRLKEGNKAFINNQLSYRNTTHRVKKAVAGQYPEAMVLSCIDSRVPVEDIFNKGIGDLFVARIAGNIIDDDILGSLEYGCKVSGSKVIVVLGHDYCGAIKSSIDGVKLGHITSVLEKIDPAIHAAKHNFDGATTSKNSNFVDRVCEFNVINSITEIREKSSILREMESNNQIKIVGAIYSLETGKVDFL